METGDDAMQGWRCPLPCRPADAAWYVPDFRHCQTDHFCQMEQETPLDFVGVLPKLLLFLILFVNAIHHGFRCCYQLVVFCNSVWSFGGLTSTRVSELRCQVGYSVDKWVCFSEPPSNVQGAFRYGHSFSHILPRWFLFVLFFTCCAQADANFDPYRATRIGEASQPGPHEHRHCTIAITNPTSIVSKPAIYQQLIDQYNLDIVAASEIAATSPAQKLFSFHMRQSHMRSQWSCPVPEKTVRSDGQPSLRGQATGVALFAKCAIRTLHGTIPEVDQASSRILHCLVDFNGYEMQMVVLYGYAASGSIAANRTLMQLAIRAVRSLPLPYHSWGPQCQSMEAWNEWGTPEFASCWPDHDACWSLSIPDAAYMSTCHQPRQCSH